MKIDKITKNTSSKFKIEGTLMTLSSVPFILASINAFTLTSKTAITALLSSISCYFCAVFIFRNQKIGKALGILTSFGCIATIFTYVIKIPFIAFISAITLISIYFILLDLKSENTFHTKNLHSNFYAEKAKFGAVTLFVISIIPMLFNIFNFYILKVGILISSLISLILFMQWTLKQKPKKTLFLFQTLTICILTSAIFISSTKAYLFLSTLILSLTMIAFIPRSINVHERKEQIVEILLNHPTRILLNTFLFLCVIGTFLLMIPAATVDKSINVLDAAFTAVSSVCVTGLIIKDTPNDFTLLGQFFILILIQLGGLGIMSIATIVLHAIGQRLSLRQERLLTSLTDTSHKNLISSLIIILKLTFFAERVGAILLTILFHNNGDSFYIAFWRGLFTSISAFCNAGFALQSNSLISYQTKPLILHTIAILIILGGISPATALFIPKWIRNKQIPIIALITLITTAILLILGTFFITVFEWNLSLSHLSIPNKIHNAWFQSTTLRTAGFNSLDLTFMNNPTFLIMLCLMFIGGSIGGTAGGIKTTTAAILAMTFWSNITNKDSIIIRNRRIRSGVIFRAVTIFMSGALIWFIIALMLEATQQISAKSIIFETTSALGTVGLSLGATTSLDEIGKIIIMIAMFVGRIGPITLFMLLSEDFSFHSSRCPDTKISLT